VSDRKSTIRIQKSEIKEWWRRRELNSDPRVNAEKLYMLSHFSSFPDFHRKKIRSTRSKWSNKTAARASPTLVSPNSTDRKVGPAYLRDISLRAHKQLAVRRSLLIRQREPIHCYWQLFFPYAF